MAKLTYVELETLNTLIKAGMPYQSALALILGSDTAKEKTFDNSKVSTNVVAKGNKNSKKGATKSSNKPAKANAFGNVKKGDFFKVVVNDTVKNIGQATSISKNDNIVNAKGGKKYALEYCIAISKKEFGSLKKTLKPAKAKTGKPVSRRLGEKDYTVVLAYLAKQKNADIDYVELANSTDNSEELKEIRGQIHKDLPDLKLSAEQALKEFASLTEKKAQA